MRVIKFIVGIAAIAIAVLMFIVVFEDFGDNLSLIFEMELELMDTLKALATLISSALFGPIILFMLGLLCISKS